ncbi:hypothetical protein ACLOJK_024149, partial [Asimina triloba]
GLSDELLTLDDVGVDEEQVTAIAVHGDGFRFGDHGAAMAGLADPKFVFGCCQDGGCLLARGRGNGVTARWICHRSCWRGGQRR